MVLAWTLFSIYLVATGYLGWRGLKKTQDFSSFAIGKGDLSPWVVGVTLAASTASAATFIINPGFVYVDGLSAWIHMVPATFLGFTSMLVLLSFAFRRIGAEAGALTIPDWIGKRYGSKGYALFFACVNLLAFAFVVLLVGGISIVMQQLLGVSNVVALIITLVFVTGYVFIGGTYAHVFTNMLQGVLMIGVTLVVLVSGFHLFFQDDPSFIETLGSYGLGMLSWVNEDGQLFNSVFSIYVAGFLVGATVVCQPHILTKALYVKTDKAVKQYLIVFTIVFFAFLLLVTVGFYAHMVVPPDQLVDPTTNTFRQDLVMTMYLKNVFPDWTFTVISVVLLAAAMSTLDGLLVGISTIAANDLLLNLSHWFGKGDLDREGRMRWAYKVSHLVLIIVAIAAFIVLLYPPKLLGIFGQVGVYGMALGVVPPLVAGTLLKKISLKLMWGASILAMVAHFGLYFFGANLFGSSSLNFANPGVCLSLSVLVVVIPALFIAWMNDRRL